MANSQNGYPANDVNLTSSRTVPGTTRRLRVRIGPAGDLLLWVAGQFDKLVEDIEQGILDDWGYAEREVRGGSDLSNHASGTAIDLNATAHPLSTAPAANFSAQEIANIRSIVARTNGCVRWGGDYTGRKDGMHFEINASQAACAQVLNALTTNTQEDDDMPDNATIKQLVKDAIVELKGNDGRSVLDGVIQTRLELRDRATEAVQNNIPAIAEAVADRLPLTGDGSVNLDALAELLAPKLVGPIASKLDALIAARMAS
jgi:hypothetical protein